MHVSSDHTVHLNLTYVMYVDNISIKLRWENTFFKEKKRITIHWEKIMVNHTADKLENKCKIPFKCNQGIPWWSSG